MFTHREISKKSIQSHLVNHFYRFFEELSIRESMIPEMSAKNGVRKRKFEKEDDDINTQVLELQSKVARLDDMNFLESLDDLKNQHEKELQKVRAAQDKKNKEFLKSQKELTQALTTTESRLVEVKDKITTIVEQNAALLQRTEKLEADLEAERNKGFINYIKSFFRRKPKEAEDKPAEAQVSGKAPAIQEEPKENEIPTETVQETETKKDE
ncbi:unnamed protein product [Oikopleura dioica]|uniref:Uncharacterized protein n=1 Tax=Oikopleura dioica TaxID=34765 RepID=E4X413_OIKDI|nr:unnamed protein product [Oikopleura dioica]CBY36777.1 unnamed protein product [Oikopleura dioica]